MLARRDVRGWTCATVAAVGYVVLVRARRASKLGTDKKQGQDLAANVKYLVCRSDPCAPCARSGWLDGWVDRCLDRWVMDGHSMDCRFRVGVCCMASWGVAVCVSVVYWSLVCREMRVVAGVAEAQEPTSCFPGAVFVCRV